MVRPSGAAEGRDVIAIAGPDRRAALLGSQCPQLLLFLCVCLFLCKSAVVHSTVLENFTDVFSPSLCRFILIREAGICQANGETLFLWMAKIAAVVSPLRWSHFGVAAELTS